MKQYNLGILYPMAMLSKDELGKRGLGAPAFLVFLIPCCHQEKVRAVGSV